MLKVAVLMMSIAVPVVAHPATAVPRTVGGSDTEWSITGGIRVMDDGTGPQAAGSGPEMSRGWWRTLTFRPIRKEVLIHGRVLVPDGQAGNVFVTVEVKGHELRCSRPESNGRFSVKIPVGSEAHLRFHEPGHLEKVVVVDTRNAAHGRRSRRMYRDVKFDVELVPVEQLSGLTYDGPVGTISFIRGSGLMKVAHHEQLVPMTAVR